MRNSLKKTTILPIPFATHELVTNTLHKVLGNTLWNTVSMKLSTDENMYIFALESSKYFPFHIQQLNLKKILITCRADTYLFQY